jgi:NADPH2:quinone reductase
MGSCAAPSAKGDDKFITTDYLQQCHAEFHLVDARIVGRKPASLDWAEAAALPLTTLTAWKPCSIAWT